MKKFRVYISWLEPREESYEVEADDEDSAAQKALDDNDEIGEDYTIDRTTCLGDVPEPIYIDPNQMRLFEEERV